METNGFLLFIPLVFLILFSEPAYRAWKGPPPVLDIDKTDSLLAWMAARQTVTEIKPKEPVAFHQFDPNHIARKELIELGLDSGIARRIIRYREKGGRFRRKEDLARIYGMDSVWFRTAANWMTFAPQDPLPSKAKSIQKSRKKEDINLADTLQLQDVYGIGPTLARRIATFRDRLGGFVSMEQLREVYGLDSAVVGRVKRQFEIAPGFEPRKINLLQATLEEISRHPYISRKQAQAILAYRAQHSLETPEQLLSLPQLDQHWLTKMRPYLLLTPWPR